MQEARLSLLGRSAPRTAPGSLDHDRHGRQKAEKRHIRVSEHDDCHSNVFRTSTPDSVGDVAQLEAERPEPTISMMQARRTAAEAAPPLRHPHLATELSMLSSSSSSAESYSSAKVQPPSWLHETVLYESRRSGAHASHRHALQASRPPPGVGSPFPYASDADTSRIQSSSTRDAHAKLVDKRQHRAARPLHAEFGGVDDRTLVTSLDLSNFPTSPHDIAPRSRTTRKIM